MKRIPPLPFLAAAILLAGLIARFSPGPMPVWLLALEVILTVLALFVFGSIPYRLDKNALTFGAGMIVAATFFTRWWPASVLREEWTARGLSALGEFVARHFLHFRALDGLIHLDTMLFIVGLTYFVSAISQSRLLETVAFGLLTRWRGRVFPTVGLLAGIVALASGILDGVSMIGLLIRTLVILLFWAKVKDRDLLLAVMLATVITTVSGMWLAYGEPPNLIMKANLHPLLTDGFFLRYCLPGALASYLLVLLRLRPVLRDKVVDFRRLDVLDRHTADVRFLQADRHGDVVLPLEFVGEHRGEIGVHYPAVVERLHRGVPFGEALVNERVPRDTRLRLLGRFLSEDLAETLDDYYVHVFGRNDHKADESAAVLDQRLEKMRRPRRTVQRWAGLSFLPFIGLLIWHAADHAVPLFFASWAGYATAFLAIAPRKKMRGLAGREAWHETQEYLFLIPLFFSISLLQKTDFFSHLARGLQWGLENGGLATVAAAQFIGTGLLSALLDNNVVADFAGRALRGFELTVVHASAMAQIAGYAVGGCLTHIGSAQSVVAFAFIRKDIAPHFTPWDWFKTMGPFVLKLTALLMAVILLEVLL